MALIAVVLSLVAPHQVQTAPVRPAPREEELGKYTDLWHRCHRRAGCTAGRNIRREGVRFKWVSGDRRHWGERPARAREVSKRIRTLRARLAVVSLTPFAGPNGTRWAIPWYIVYCESHGNWNAANPSGAVGPYQLLGWGAPFPANTQAKRMAHHRIAARLWRTQGSAPWVCR